MPMCQGHIQYMFDCNFLPGEHALKRQFEEASPKWHQLKKSHTAAYPTSYNRPTCIKRKVANDQQHHKMRTFTVHKLNLNSRPCACIAVDAGFEWSSRLRWWPCTYSMNSIKSDSTQPRSQPRNNTRPSYYNALSDSMLEIMTTKILVVVRWQTCGKVSLTFSSGL